MSNAMNSGPTVQRVSTHYYANKQKGYAPKDGSVNETTRVLPPVEPATAYIPVQTAPHPQYAGAAQQTSHPQKNDLEYEGQQYDSVPDYYIPPQAGANWMGWVAVLLSFFGFSPVAIILCHVALSDIKHGRRYGSRAGLMTATILSYIAALPVFIFTFVALISLLGF